MLAKQYEGGFSHLELVLLHLVSIASMQHKVSSLVIFVEFSAAVESRKKKRSQKAIVMSRFFIIIIIKFTLWHFSFGRTFGDLGNI